MPYIDAKLDVLPIEGISLIRAWVEKNNPELWGRISSMSIYDGTCEICKEYGIDIPAGTDLVEPSSISIFEKLMRIQ